MAEIRQLERPMGGPMITRMCCQMCHKRHGMGFTVPREMWQAVMLEKYWWGEICLECFIAEADEKLVRWCDVIEFHPVSLVAHLELAGALKKTIDGDHG